MTAVLLPNRFSESKFSESFWSNSKGDYVTGLNVLHAKIDQGAVEDQEILTYIRERIDLDGFLRDDGASLRRTFETIKTESIDLGNGHIALANNLRDLVLEPLLRFTQARQATQQSRDDIENRLKLFDKHLLELDKAHATYVTKCNAADQAEMEANKLAHEEARASVDITDADRRHEFASQRFTIQELNKFLNRMRREVPSQDVKVPILGVYNNCCSGSLIAHWIQQNTKARTIEEAEHIGQSLADEGFLRLIGQRGNNFKAYPDNFYQWRDQMFELLDDDDKEEELSVVKKMKQEAEKADAVYLAAVKKADMTRLQLEVGLFSHMDLLQHFEHDRIDTIKGLTGTMLSPNINPPLSIDCPELQLAFLNFAAIFSNIISITQAVADHLLIFQEALRPSKDVQYVIEQYRTGAFVPMPTLYNNFYHGTGLDQVFGVNIDKHCNFTRKKVPQLVMKCLTRIKKSSANLTNEQKLQCWTTEVPLADIHVLRNKINHGGKITQKLLRLFDVATIVGVLRLYFLELPGSLVSGDEYETVKIIYSGVTDETNDTKNDARISSIRNLLGLLSSARFYTLFEVIKHVSNLIKETSADDTFLTFMAYRWGPVFLRPLEENAITMHDKHPQRMMRDMLRMTNHIFEPIRMSREEGNLSRSTTTRTPAAGLGRRRGGPLGRLSRDMKGGPASLLADPAHPVPQVQAQGPGNVVPEITVGGEPVKDNVAQDAGSGVGVGSPAAAGAAGAAGTGAVGPAKPQRRLGPSSGRFTLARVVSAPEMFSEVPAFKKRAAAAAAAATANGEATPNGQEGTENQNPGLLTTAGLKVTAGGDKNSRSPLRQSLMASEEDVEEKEEGEEEAEDAHATPTTPENDVTPTPASQQEEQGSYVELEPVKDDDGPMTTASEASSTTMTEAQEDTTDWKAVSGAEFEATGRKLERRRKNRQSALSNGQGSDGTLNMGELSAESVLQALRDEDN
ncbi:MAG: hypothetical protein J3Q66DRAFT_418046 [Benniella sp.]|nr:MAG: hypothetical protein J3Q66DRAFT_418046 [Benniella sp.]